MSKNVPVVMTRYTYMTETIIKAGLSSGKFDLQLALHTSRWALAKIMHLSVWTIDREGAHRMAHQDILMGVQVCLQDDSD